MTLIKIEKNTQFFLAVSSGSHRVAAGGRKVESDVDIALGKAAIRLTDRLNRRRPTNQKSVHKPTAEIARSHLLKRRRRLRPISAHNGCQSERINPLMLCPRHSH